MQKCIFQYTQQLTYMLKHHSREFKMSVSLFCSFSLLCKKIPISELYIKWQCCAIVRHVGAAN